MAGILAAPFFGFIFLSGQGRLGRLPPLQITPETVNCSDLFKTLCVFNQATYFKAFFAMFFYVLFFDYCFAASAAHNLNI